MFIKKHASIIFATLVLLTSLYSTASASTKFYFKVVYEQPDIIELELEDDAIVADAYNAISNELKSRRPDFYRLSALILMHNKCQLGNNVILREIIHDDKPINVVFVCY